MSNSYFGDSSWGDRRSGSSRKGKKSNSDKPKQPQRGLGVAQLEKIRLESEMGCSYLPSFHSPSQPNLNQEEEMTFAPTSAAASYGFHSNIMAGIGDMAITDIRYGDSHSSTAARTNWNQPQQAAQTNVTRQFLKLRAEDSAQKKRRHDWRKSTGSSSHNSDSSDGQELDLDLKL